VAFYVKQNVKTGHFPEKKFIAIIFLLT